MLPELKAAVEALLAARARGGLQREAARLSAHYRAGGRSDSAIDLAAYLTVRLPATYAAVARVLSEIAALRPGFEPESLLDAGAGPGTASWAAAARWRNLRRITMLDAHPGFLDLSRELASRSAHPGLANAARKRGGLARIDVADTADLVIASYSLAELAPAALRAALDCLWNAASSMLVLVEPGTPAGFARIATARERLIAKGAVPLAPCPHAAPCPLTRGGWCHFSVRLARSRAHLHAKAASVPFEDEKFAYLALARDGIPVGGGRILAPPRESKAGIDFSLCTESGLVRRHVARRDAELYKRHRKMNWGGLIGPEAGEPT